MPEFTAIIAGLVGMGFFLVYTSSLFNGRDVTSQSFKIFLVVTGFLVMLLVPPASYYAVQVNNATVQANMISGLSNLMANYMYVYFTIFTLFVLFFILFYMMYQ